MKHRNYRIREWSASLYISEKSVPENICADYIGLLDADKYFAAMANGTHIVLHIATQMIIGVGIFSAGCALREE